MKTVFTDISHIAHLWANQLQSEAKNGSRNFYFDGNTIYSYGRHFPIAKHITNANGENAVLFTERTYSVTTSKHLSVVRQAMSHKTIIYCFNPESTHDENFNSWKTQAESVAEKLLKAKKPEKYLSELSGIRYKAERYSQFFNVPIPETLLAVLNIGNKDQYSQYLEKKQQYAAAEQKRIEAENKKRHKKELGEWLKGKTHRLYTRNGQDYLRLNGDHIETTQAIKIPIEYGRKIWERIKTGNLKEGDKVLNFEVSEVSDKVVIGCHTFPVKYLVEFGNKTF